MEIQQEVENPNAAPYWTVKRIDDLISRLREKYNYKDENGNPVGVEDTAEVCALLEFRKILKILRVHG